MSKFLTELDTHLKTDSETVWVLNTPLIYNSDLVGQVVVPARFETDLSSVPRIPVIYAIWGARAHREGILHDYLFCEDSAPIVSWGVANSVFLEAQKSRGKSLCIRYPMYWGVCLGSYGFYHRRKVFDEVY